MVRVSMKSCTGIVVALWINGSTRKVRHRATGELRWQEQCAHDIIAQVRVGHLRWWDSGATLHVVESVGPVSVPSWCIALQVGPPD